MNEMRQYHPPRKDSPEKLSRLASYLGEDEIAINTIRAAKLETFWKLILLPLQGIV